VQQAIEDEEPAETSSHISAIRLQAGSVIVNMTEDDKKHDGLVTSRIHTHATVTKATKLDEGMNKETISECNLRTEERTKGSILCSGFNIK
jgi:hypothetical protein